MGGRRIEIFVQDAAGRPVAGVTVSVTLNGRNAGKIVIGSRSEGRASIELVDGDGSVELIAGLLGLTLTESVAPQQTKVLFQFQQAPRYALPVKAVATCPDGTSNSPCVVCRDGADTWKLCS